MPTLLDLVNASVQGRSGSRVSLHPTALAALATKEGIQGPTGPQGPPGDIVWLGAWDTNTLYLEDDAVEHNGSSYIATATNTGSAPPSANWELLAAKGATGATGATGSQGVQGETGAQGEQGSQGPQGDPGPNSISGSTTTALTGLLKGTGSVVAVATAPTDYVATGDSRLSDARTPTAHKASHQHAGSDEVATATAAANAIPKAGGAGTLAIGWIPLGSSSSTVCVGNDSRLSDARAPTTHAASHVTGGSDIIAAAIAGGASGLLTGADKSKLDGIAFSGLTKITVGTTEPTSPSVGDLWVDTN